MTFPPTPGDPPGDDEPFLPEELTALLEQLGGPQIANQIRMALSSRGGPVNWDIARQVALQLAAPEDRSPTPQERRVAEDAQRLAEHWLDQGSLPAPPDAGRLAVVSRQEWVNAALEGLRPLVEPVASASIQALGELVRGQVHEFGAAELGELGFGADFGMLGRLLEPMGAVLMGLQSGQVVGQLSRDVLGQFDLGVPTADRTTAYHLAVNVAETFAGYGLDPMEVAVVLALQEGAHRRQYHAVPWLLPHVHALVASFAAGMRIDADQLLEVSRDIMGDVDPEDPESLRVAMERAGQVRLEPTPQQRRVLERIQGVVCLLQAWSRHEVQAAGAVQLPNLARVEEVLRRRRAAKAAGESLLANLLGLDLKPEDESVGDRFVAAVHEARGPEGLRRALAHPENLPDAEELADPSRWLMRMAAGEQVPDDPSSLLGMDEAPVEPPADQRRPREGPSGGDRPD